jgi:hypothetical protein
MKHERWTECGVFMKLVVILFTEHETEVYTLILLFDKTSAFWVICEGYGQKREFLWSSRSFVWAVSTEILNTSLTVCVCIQSTKRKNVMCSIVSIPVFLGF